MFKLWKLAIRDLGRNKRRSSLSLLAVALGVALLVVTKAAGYGVSLGSGFRGGPVFPALFLGAAVGIFFSLVVPGLELTPAVVAGMAGGAAAMLKLPVSSVMLAVVVAGSAGLQATTLAIVGAVVSIVVTLAASSRQPNKAQK